MQRCRLPSTSVCCRCSRKVPAPHQVIHSLFNLHGLGVPVEWQMMHCSSLLLASATPCQGMDPGGWLLQQGQPHAGVGRGAYGCPTHWGLHQVGLCVPGTGAAVLARLPSARQGEGQEQRRPRTVHTLPTLPAQSCDAVPHTTHENNMAALNSQEYRPQRKAAGAAGAQRRVRKSKQNTGPCWTTWRGAPPASLPLL